MIDVKKKKNTFQQTGRFQQVFANMLVEMFKYLINKSKCVLKYVASIQWWTILFLKVQNNILKKSGGQSVCQSMCGFTVCGCI